MADIITAIVDVLRAEAAIAALVDGHAYGDELPREVVELMPRGALVVQASGGAPFQPASMLRAEAQRFDLVAYGPTPFEADALRRAGYRCLLAVQRRVIGGVLIHWVQSAGGALAGRDRDGQWPFALQSFQTLFATEEVSDE